jgi:hypothetical protein
MGKDHCLDCGKELGVLNKMKPDKNWELPEGSLLCSECWSHRKNPEGHIKAEERAINYEGECVTVVQIPPALTRDAWNKVDKLVQSG